jgi:hypothetical protein
MFGLKAQDLDTHKWDKRVVLVISDNRKDNRVIDQLNEFRSNIAGMEERKLVVNQLLPGKWNNGLNSPSVWNESDNKLYQRYNSDNTEFAIILIGLDGGVKFRDKEPVTCKELFAVIDGMPMRKRELNNNR